MLGYTDRGDYTLEQGPGMAARPPGHRAWPDVGASGQEGTDTRLNGGQRGYRTPVGSAGHEPWLR
jgi:hypothetical protein